MKNPNGYSCVKKLSGHRRRPYIFVVSEDGKQRVIGAFPSHVEALIFQTDYNLSHGRPRLSDNKITWAELYHRWLPAHIEHTGPSASTISGYRAAYLHCVSLYDMEVAKIKYRNLQAVIDDMKKAGLSYSSCKKVRSLLSLTFKYALRMEYTHRSFDRLIQIGKNKPVRPHHPFSRQKINRLWSIADTPGADTVLMLIYSGMRVNELLNLRKADVHRRQRFFDIRHFKTAAGIRIIPIHDRIWPLVEARMERPGEYLISDADGHPYSYARYCTLWQSVMAAIRGEGHTTHDCRHTCATLLDNAGANPNSVRRILGHAGGDVTDRVYTHKAIRQLRKAMNLIK